MLVSPELVSAKPYLVRAIYEWCGDQACTPYVSVFVDDMVQVPREFVRDGEITLNIGVEAANSLTITNDMIEFKARFGGIPRQIMVPITHVMAIYARETGQGMAFPISDANNLLQTPVEGLPMPTPTKLAAKPIMKKVAEKASVDPEKSTKKSGIVLKRVK